MPKSPDSLSLSLSLSISFWKPNVYTHTHIYIIRSCWQHRFPKLFHSLSLSLSLLEHGHRIRSFRLTWLCLIVEVLATRAKFLQSSGYCTVISFAVDFRTTNVFLVASSGVIALFKLIKLKFPSSTKLHIHLSLSNHNRNEWKKMHNMSVHKLLWYLQPEREPFTAWTALVTWYTRCKTRAYFENIAIFFFLLLHSYHLTLYGFFTPVLGGDNSLESKWQQVSSDAV